VEGRWGSAIEFSAEQTENGQPARVWIVPAGAPGPALRRHRAALRRLTEEPPLEGVAPLLDWGEEEDPPVLWLAASPQEGVRLSALLDRGGALEPERAARLGVQVCDALSAAHTEGIYHFGLTPAAVWLEDPAGEGERARVFGFSLGAGMVEPGSLAPEFSHRVRPDERTDLWGLATVLRACLQGGGRPPPRLAALLSWCGAADPGRRPPDVATVRAELDAVRQGHGALSLLGRLRLRSPGRRLAWLGALGVLAGAALCGLLALALADLPVRQDLARGEAALAAGDAAGAVLAYGSAVRRAPERPEGHRGLARAREALGLTLAAAEAWQSYLALVPGDAQGQRAHARLLLAGGEASRAAEHAARAAAQAPSDPESHRLHGEALEAAGDLAAAAASYERAVALAPTDPSLHAALGRTLARDPARREGALEALAEAWRLEPGRPERRLALADFLAVGLLDCDAATPHFRALLEAGQHQAEAEHGLGHCLALTQADGERALDHLQRAARLDPHSVRFRLALARLQRDRGGGCEAAAEAFSAAARLAPRDVTVLAEVAACLREQEDWCAAGKVYRTLSELEAGSADWETLAKEAAGRCP